VLFYQALAIFAEGLGLWVVLGAVAAAVTLGITAYAVIALGKKLPLRQLLIVGASTLLLLSVAFAGNAVRSLQGADWLPVTPIEGDWARLQIFLAELTGIHPTREGIAVQAALLTIYVAGATYLFVWKRLRQPLEAARA
jgi:high-affinity Fe2+/Pb2+ permease